ncbi:MAG: hypothetical protein NZN28_11945 [Meiothermus sp.]|uniref:hypothetical protein n=1 Tax=Meiothermus sp. TaxID=1955249 RepID=UPI0025F10123|nr:hypothetical protein [Meiothermus sp.]MCS7069324.1 hypothetical protein [Meiothermus sp.]
MKTVLQTPEDVARAVRKHPRMEFDLRNTRKETVRLYAQPSGSLVVWRPHHTRPMLGLINLSEVELGPGPYELEVAHDPI